MAGTVNVVLNQYSDNFFHIRMVDALDVYQSADNFTDAQYVIAQSHGAIMLELTLGNGITVVDLQGERVFLVHIEDALIPFTGKFYDQFIVWDAQGNKEAPRFQRRISVNKVYSA